MPFLANDLTLSHVIPASKIRGYCYILTTLNRFTVVKLSFLSRGGAKYRGPLSLSFVAIERTHCNLFLEQFTFLETPCCGVWVWVWNSTGEKLVRRKLEKEKEREKPRANVHTVGDITGEEHDNYPEVGNATPNKRLDGTNSWENEKRGENRDWKLCKTKPSPVLLSELEESCPSFSLSLFLSLSVKATIP